MFFFETSNLSDICIVSTICALLNVRNWWVHQSHRFINHQKSNDPKMLSFLFWCIYIRSGLCEWSFCIFKSAYGPARGRHG